MSETNWKKCKRQVVEPERSRQHAVRLVVDDVVERFEDAWQRGERPTIDSLLPQQSPFRLAALIELVHCDLELRVSSDKPRHVEDYLRTYAELREDSSVAIELIEAEFRLRRRSGQRVSVEEYLDRFPEFRELLAGRLSGGTHARESDASIEPTSDRPDESSDGTAQRSAETLPASSCAAKAEDRGSPMRDTVPSRLARFEILEAVGHGSFGTVYRAYDPKLDRIVALKTPRRDWLASPEEEQRFLREARSAAQLSHPGIVQVFEVVQDGMRPYIVSEYVAGETLSQVIARREFSFRAMATIVLRIADALQHAHANGVVHRDLKPSNIMLEENGESLRPRLMDFGLARREHGESTVTLEGQILGTPAYMSPEQAGGGAKRVDRRSDIYSLGIVLYQLLTREVPFRGAIRMLLVQVQYEDPRAPRKLNDQIPRDLETICLKCLEKDPGARYSEARDLADDLHRFLNGQPIHARPIGRAARLWRWCKRSPRVAALSCLSGVLGTLIIVLMIANAEFNRKAYERERTARRDVERNLYYSYIHQATLEYQTNRLSSAKALLEKASPVAGEKDWRGWEWHFLNKLMKTHQYEFKAGVPGAEWVTCLAFSPDGRLLAAGSGVPPYLNRTSTVSASLKVWDVSSGDLLLDLEGQTLSIASLAFSPDGRRIAAAEQDWYFRPGELSFAAPGMVRMWNIDSGREFERIQEARGIFGRVAFSPGGQFLAAGGPQCLRIWNVNSGEVACDFKGMSLWEFRSRDTHVEAVDDQRSLHLFELPSGNRVQTLGELPPGERSPNGCLSAAIFDRHRALRVWDVSTCELRSIIPHDGVLGFAFRSDGRLLARGAADGTVRVWDLDRNNERFIFRGHHTHVQSVAFQPAGRLLASGDWNGRVLVWDATHHPEYAVLGQESQQNHPVEALAFLPGDAHIVALRQRLKRLTIWDVDRETPRRDRTFPVAFERQSPSRRAALRFDGRRLAGVSADDEKVIKIWDAKSGKELTHFTRHLLPVQFVTFGRDHDLVASAAWDWEPKSGRQSTVAEILIWNCADGNVLFDRTEEARRVFRIALHANREILATASVRLREQPDGKTSAQSYELKVWDMATGRCLLRNEDHQSRILGLAFSDDGQFLASASYDDGAVKLWNLETKQFEMNVEQGSKGIEDLAFSPDGRRLAGVTRRDVSLWDTTTGHKVVTLRGRQASDNPIFNPQVIFSSDGNHIAATQFDDTISVWSVARPAVSINSSHDEKQP